MPVIIKNTDNNDVKIISGYTIFALILAIISVFINLCCFITAGIPLGFAFGIFSIAFTIISKENSKLSKLCIILSIIGIVVSILMFLYLLYVLNILNDPAAATYYYDYINMFIHKK